MIRNERQKINRRRVGDYIYRVDLDGYLYNDCDLETMSSAFFYDGEEAFRYARKHCNDKGVHAAYIYWADGDDVFNEDCETWEDMVELFSYELKSVEFSEAYFESED